LNIVVKITGKFTPETEPEIDFVVSPYTGVHDRCPIKCHTQIAVTAVLGIFLAIGILPGGVVPSTPEWPDPLEMIQV
jgi:hypothetical protein